MTAPIDMLPPALGDTLLNVAFNALGEKYVVSRGNGQKIFAATPRPVKGDDNHTIRVYYPPQGGGTRPIHGTITADEARAMVDVLQNAIDYEFATEPLV